MVNLRSGRAPNLRSRQTPNQAAATSNNGRGGVNHRNPSKTAIQITSNGKSRKRQRTEEISSDDEGEDEDSHTLPNCNFTVRNSSNKTTQPTSDKMMSQQTAIPMNISEEDDDLPSLTTYDAESTKLAWPPARCKAKLAQGFTTKASNDGIEERRNLCRKWDHLQMLMALALRCSLRTVNKHIGMIREKRERIAYINFLEFGCGALEEPMPNRDDPDVAEKFSQLNKSKGESWSLLNDDQKAVFERRILLALAGIPDLAADDVESDSESDGEGDSEVRIPEVTPLSDEEEEKYCPIYEEIVDHQKVISLLGPAVPGVSDAVFTRRSFRCVQKHTRDLTADARRHQFDFWLITASAVPPLSPKTPSWIKVYTTLPVLTKFLTTKANFPAIFGAVAQGTLVLKAVTAAAGNNTIGKPARKNASDKEKVDFGNTLVMMLTKLVGSKPAKGMPRGRNPQEVLAKREPPIRMVLDPSSRLKMADLEVGFSKMGADKRRAWKKDCMEGLFRFEKKLGEKWVGKNYKKKGRKNYDSEEEQEEETEEEENDVESGDGGENDEGWVVEHDAEEDNEEEEVDVGGEVE